MKQVKRMKHLCRKLNKKMTLENIKSKKVCADCSIKRCYVLTTYSDELESVVSVKLSALEEALFRSNKADVETRKY